VDTSLQSPPPAGLPDWVSVLKPGEWYEIPNTALSSVAPSPTPLGWTGPSSKVDAWTSFVVDTRTSKVYSLANGGHADYAGNEVDVLELELAQPRWAELIAPTPNEQISASVYCGSYYVDGRPTSRHSYYGVTLNEFDDRIMLFGGAQWCNAGGFHNKVDSYNIGSNSWNPANTHPDVPVDLIAHGMSVNPSTGDVYMLNQHSLRRWNRSSNTWTEINPVGGITSADGYYAMSAFDTARGRVLFLSDQVRRVYSLADNTFAPVTLSGPNAATVLVGAAALVYVPAVDRFLVRLAGAGGAIYEIHPTSFEVQPFRTSGGDAVPATLYGPYNKFLYVPRLHGAVYVPTHGGNAWFLRIH